MVPVIEDIFESSPAQLGILFECLSSKEPDTYVTQLVLNLSGEVDSAQFRRAWESIVARHSALRTAFVWEGVEKPVQVLRHQVEFEWKYEDWTAIGSEAERQRRLDSFLAMDKTRGLRPDIAPLFRFALISLSPAEHVFIWTHHHLLLDGWSTAIVVREAFAAYEAEGAPDNAIPQAEQPYSDFIGWLQSKDLAPAEAFWREKLREFSPPALGVSAPPVSLGHAAVHQELERRFEPALSASITRFARSAQVTAHTVFEAAWALLLSRYADQDDVVFGSTVSGRPPELVGSDSMVGMFMNTLPVRVRMSIEEPLLQWLRRLQLEQAELRDFEHSPLIEIKKWSGLPPAAPLFETILSFENYPLDLGLASPARGLRITGVQAHQNTRYPLTLIVMPGARYTLKLGYDATRCTADSADRILEQMETILRGFLESPEARIFDLPMLASGELTVVLPGRRVPSADLSAGIHQRFEQQAAAAPGRIAVLCSEQSVTYGELNASANRLARFLRSRGARQESVVAICLDQTPDFITAILAVLKCGGAYLPMNPQDPADRHAFMLRDAGASLVITTSEMREHLGAFDGNAVFIDGDDAEIRTLSGDNLAVVVDSANLAYTIYTSGSTGAPKGTCLTHGNVLRLFDACQDWFHFCEQDVWTLFHALTFDFSVWELFGALTYGGTLVMVPAWTRREPKLFYDLLVRNRVTVLSQTPSAFYPLLAEDRRRAGPLSLRVVVFGGEALDFAQLAPWFERHNDASPVMVNMYGITETTVHVTYRPIRAHETAGASLIGVPIPDLELMLLDRHLRPVPIGAAGEIYVAGPGLARGYGARPALTAERFLPNPFSAVPGDRLYKSGDLARRIEGGDIEYLGRRDRQVKIRGYRVELGEVESALRRHPGVRQAGVTLREDDPGERRMVAYVVPAPQTDLTNTDLRRFLLQRLPDYMLPAAFVVLPTLPLTAHGKLDYRALPSPGRERPNIAAGFDRAATPTEATLAEIWAEALGLESVGAEDNFFELGGDSIRSIRVISLARAKGFELSVDQLFANPTIRELARTLVPAESASSPTLPFALLPPKDQPNLSSAISDAYPLTKLQAGMLFHSSYAPSSTTYHDIFSSHVAVPFRLAPMQKALDEIIAAHDILRTSFELTSYSEPLQLVHRTADCQIEFFDLSKMTPADQEKEIAGCVEAEKHRGFNWSVPPLLRILAHTRGDRSFQLTLSFHHAILDGWSVASFARELFQRYLDLQQLSPGAPPAPPACRFADHVALEQRALQSADLKAFWSDQVRGADPCDIADNDTLAHSAEKSRQVKSCPVDLSPSVVERLSGVARQWGIPLKTVLLAAHLKFVSYITGREEVVTGYITNTRPEQPGGDEVLGLFLNTVPFRAKLAAMAWSDLVLQTFAAERDILLHRRYPAVQIQLDVDAARLFDTAFNFVHYHLYDALSGSVEVLGGLAHEETSLTLMSEFQMQPGSGNLSLRLNYDVGVIDETAITAYAGYFSRILRAIADEPLAAHQLASFLPDEEAGQCPVASVAPASLELPCSAIEARAAESPDAPALFSGGKPVSYRELNAGVNRIARYLRMRGVGPETRLAVSMEPLAEGITALLAALKCGAAIAPLESALPYDYVASLLLDLRPAWVLAGPAVPEEVPGCNAVMIDLARLQGAAANEDVSNPENRAAPDNAAYILYQSGSLGPVSLCLTYRNLAAYVSSFRAMFTKDECSRSLVGGRGPETLLETLAILSAGGAILCDSGADFAGPAVSAPLTLIACPASTVNTFTNRRDVSSLRALCLSDEIPGHELMKALEQWRTKVKIGFLFGPPETARCASAYIGPVPEGRLIGDPVSGSRLYVLDRHGQPVPPGAVGDLYIGGEILARGFLGRPDLTAESFLPDRFSRQPGARLYHSGIRVKRRFNGVIEYLDEPRGRALMHGRRVIFGEIAAALKRHRAVKEAAVVVREGPTDLLVIVAYVTLQASAKIADGDLLTFVRTQVPEYMAPTAVVILASLPLTDRGELDLKALPAFADARAEHVEFVPPRTETERTLAAIWSNLLHVEHVSIHDDFFELGGHSLVALQLASRASEVFEVELSPRDVFESPTIAEFADRMVMKKAEMVSPDALAQMLDDIEAANAPEAEHYLAPERRTP